ncbi:ferredoxin [Thermococcus sp. M39]|uniref:4Fe-4S domain-containing protein n=1 Tax=Thermococcus sp. M39 TaxID=1638262 RepID=UPI00143AEAD1|nr:ferredoxin [Thermococcus sp. M39]
MPKFWTCLEVFQLDDGGKAIVLREIIDESLYDCVKEAVDACTAACIYIEQIK